MSRSRIAIIGNYGAGNLGDDAILEALVGAFLGSDLVVFAASPQKVSLKAPQIRKIVPLLPVGLRSWLRGSFFKSYRALRECDAVIIGGGGLFQDRYFLAPIIWGWQFLWAKVLKKPVYLVGHSVGPLQTWLGKIISARVFKNAQYIGVRDSVSCEILQSLGVPVNEINLGSDLTFLLPERPIPSNTSHLPKVLLSLRPLPTYPKRFEEHIIDLLHYLHDDLKMSIHFVVMQHETKESDSRFYHNLKQHFPSMKLEEPQNYIELQDLLCDASLCIGMRFHFLLFSLRLGVPALAIDTNPKIRGLFSDLSLESCVFDLAQAEKGDPKQKLIDIFQKEDSFKRSLIDALQAHKIRTQTQMDELKRCIMKNH